MLEDEGALSVCYRVPVAVDGRMRAAPGTLFLGLRDVCVCVFRVIRLRAVNFTFWFAHHLG